MVITKLDAENIHIYAHQLVSLDDQAREIWGNLYSNEAWTERNFRLELPQKWDFSFLALERNSVVGFLIANKASQSIVHINRFVVLEDLRKKGIGSKLNSSLIHSAKKYPIFVITLIVSFYNTQAIKFYEKQGYIRCMYDDIELFTKNRDFKEIGKDYFVNTYGSKLCFYKLTLR